MLKVFIVLLTFVPFIESYLTWYWVQKARKNKKYPSNYQGIPQFCCQTFSGNQNQLNAPNYHEFDQETSTQGPQPIPLYNGLMLSGIAGLPDNTYIKNGYQDYNGNFVAMKLFKNPYYIHWDAEKDEQWRSKTKSEYFENKIPGFDLIMPASVVVSAATAFGLETLFRLNVPAGKPLMYCRRDAYDLAQLPIIFNEKVYDCLLGESILVSDFSWTRKPVEDGDHEIMRQCDESEESCPKIYSKNGILLSKTDIYCDSTVKIGNTKMINCFDGYLHPSLASRIPVFKTESSTTEKNLSFAAQVHVTILKMLGRYEVLEKSTEATTRSYIYHEQHGAVWVPRALRISRDFISL